MSLSPTLFLIGWRITYTGKLFISDAFPGHRSSESHSSHVTTLDDASRLHDASSHIAIVVVYPGMAQSAFITPTRAKWDTIPSCPHTLPLHPRRAIRVGPCQENKLSSSIAMPRRDVLLGCIVE